MATHVFTSIIANYIPKARVLAYSVKKQHPEIVFHLFLSDAIPPALRLEDEPFDSVWTVDTLGIERPEAWVFQHSIVEVSTGIKGFALLKLLGLPDCTEVLYFDPDIVVLNRLDGLLRHFESSSILLTPHLADPETTMDSIVDNELCALQHGIYNLGFLGVKNSAEGRKFAQWWADRLNHFCFDDIPKGLFTDQRWVDLAPAFFADLAILRDPGYNVCTWNLTHRKVEGTLESGLTANGQPLIFYHFSGLDSGAQQAMLNKYGGQMPALYELRDWYMAECERKGQGTMSAIPWKYARFDNGASITAAHRKRYRERPVLREAFPHPFSTKKEEDSYFHWF
ncbi:MAG: glycosyl transferase, partial [Bryobacteraceae bacterium]